MSETSVYTDADIIASLKRENAELRDQLTRAQARCGGLMVDRDRGIEAALARSLDCAEHGQVLRHWQQAAQWHWAASGQQENARQSIVAALIRLQRDELEHRTEPVPVDVLCRWLGKAIDAQKKVPRKPEGWPPLEEYMHAGCVCAAGPGADGGAR